MLSLILDLARQVRGVLRLGAGGFGNTRGWGRGTIVAASNRTGGDLSLMTLVRAVTAGGPRVEPTDTDAETDVLGLVVGYLDSSGLLIEADAPDGSTVAVLKDGVAAVLIDSNVNRGDYAFATTTSGQARGDPTLATGAFGQFVAGGGADQYALVRVGLAGGGGGAGGSIGTPALTLSTTNAAGSGSSAVGVNATIAAFDATAPVTQAFGDTAAAGSAAKAARRDHKHGMPASPTFTQDVWIEVAASNETGAVTVGTGKVTFRAPGAFTLTGVRASLKTAQASGSIFTVDILKNGSSVLSTLITIDNTEKTSTTAATPPVISTSAIGDDDEITISVTQIGDGTAIGLKIALIGTKP